MKTNTLLLFAVCAGIFGGCAAVVPLELVNAREAYRRASTGIAAQVVPAEVHKAREALVLAEQSFQKDPKSYKTLDLAYVAQRKSQLAAALGALAADKASKTQADADFQKKQGEMVTQGKQDLSDSRSQTMEAMTTMAADKVSQAKTNKQAKQDLSDSRNQTMEAVAARDADNASNAQANADSQKKQDELAKENKQDLRESEKRTADALAALAQLAAVKEEERGLVVTLSGSVLFRSAESTLLPTAQTKLDQVVHALLAVRTRNLIVEGHTDSQGTASDNQSLSQRRADAVRAYLMHGGYPADRIQARGMGMGSPIADNASPEGRANNRRVEIIIERELHTSNP